MVIFKIIDFGKTIFTFKNKVFMNDIALKMEKQGAILLSKSSEVHNKEKN